MFLTEVARKLRKSMTKEENRLWYFLRAGRLERYKFRRQEPIGNYIVDYVCFEKKMIVECDGGHHLKSDNDQRRDLYFHQRGYRVLRFWNNEILNNIDGVLEVILGVLKNATLPLTPSLREGG